MGKFVFFGMFFLMGALFALLGWSAVKDARKKMAQWSRVEGVVTGFVERRGSKGSTLYAPTYTYRVGGVEQTATSGTASTPPDYKVGDSVRLLVNPSNLSESEIVDRNTWIFSWGLLGMGSFVLAISCLILWAILTGNLK
ncbi:MAG: DUF3592 domain-containing protein [Pseudomonadota bacterium]